MQEPSRSTSQDSGADAEVARPHHAVLELGELELGLWTWPPDARRAGSVQSPLVLALHGFTGSGLDFQPLVDHLGCEVVAPDLLGHGRSAAPKELDPYKLGARLERLAALVQGLREPPVLLGYSMGGRIALQLAVRFPHLFEGLVLVGASPGIREPAAARLRRQQDEELAQRIEREGVGPFVEFWRQRPVIRSQERIAAPHRQAMRDRKLLNQAHGLAQTLRAIGTGHMSSVWDQLPHLDLPVLLVTGKDDPVFSDTAESMDALLVRSRAVVVEQAGHCVHLEQPESTGRVIRPFLEQLASSRRSPTATVGAPAATDNTPIVPGGGSGRKLPGLLAAVGLALSLLMVSPPAWAQTSQQLFPIVNGEEESEFPAVVALGAEFNGNAFSACTGTLITPRLVLSAAHCGGDLPLEAVVEFGRAFFGPDVTSPDEVLTFESLVAHEDYEELDGSLGGSRGSNDISVLVLEFEASAQPVWFRRQEVTSDDFGTELTSIGFGTTSGEGGGGGVKRSAVLTLDSLDDQFLISLSETNDNEANICGGDSGGPQMVLEGERWVQWSVHSWGDSNCDAISGSTRTDLVSEWILDRVEEVHGTRDVCDVNSLYNDGICDEFCDEADSDCVQEVAEDGLGESGASLQAGASGCSGCSLRSPLLRHRFAPEWLLLLLLVMASRKRRPTWHASCSEKAQNLLGVQDAYLSRSFHLRCSPLIGLQCASCRCRTDGGEHGSRSE